MAFIYIYWWLLCFNLACVLLLLFKRNNVFLDIDIARYFDIYSIIWTSIDWTYNVFCHFFSVETIIKAYIFSDWLYDNNYFFLSEVMIRVTVCMHGFEIFISSIFDQYLKNFFLKFELSEDQFRRGIGMIDPTLFALFHPDAVPLSKNTRSTFILRNFTKFQLAICDFIDKYSLLTPIHFCFQAMLLLLIAFVFISFFCSFFSKETNELQADTEYSVSSIASEAEKELFAIDDATCLFFLLFFIFAAYFGFFALVIDIDYSEFLIFFSAVPFVVIILVLVPCNLIFDFGLLFVAYLRGVANTSSFFFELVYDYIGIAAFFTRLVVQFVRLALMFIVYCMMHDAVVLFYIPLRSQVFGDSFWDELCMLRPTIGSISFFFLLVLPARIGYWIYEVLHTFFVVTVQFAAFFTIIFWLFLLFYTFFVYEEYEHYFEHLRFTLEKLEDEIKKLKNLEK